MDIYPKEIKSHLKQYPHLCVHSSIVYNSQDTETASVHQQMNEERKCGIHTYIYSEVLFSHLKKEILTFATTWMKLKGTMLSVISKTVKNKYSMISHVESKKKTLHRNKEKNFGYWGWSGRNEMEVKDTTLQLQDA